MQRLPNRIQGANVTILDGVCVVSKHLTCPAEYEKLWRSLGQPTLVEKTEDGIPYLTCTIEGHGWYVHLNLMARRLNEVRFAA